MISWLEVSLTVDAELAEAVADVLARFAPHGVVLETERLDPDGLRSRPSATTQVRAYLPKNESLASRVQQLETGLWHLGQIRPMPTPVYRDVADEDWSEAWKASYRPLLVGRRLQIVPAWLEAPASDRLTLWMDPGMAFGTGSHPTTRLCLEALERALRPGMVVADVGCGSGILSFAAAALGAKRVLACDIDVAAVEATLAGAERNRVADSILTFEGSVEDMDRALASEGLTPDIVLGNLLESILLDLIPRGLGRRLRPHGRLIVSGILAEQEERVRRAAEQNGFRWLETLSEGDWRALALERT